MKWAARAGVHIDRAACAWLIRRHVDDKAEFVFVDDPAQGRPISTTSATTLPRRRAWTWSCAACRWSAAMTASWN